MLRIHIIFNDPDSSKISFAFENKISIIRSFITPEQYEVWFKNRRKINLALFFFKTLKIVCQWPGSGTIFYLGDPESRYGSPCKWNGSYALKKGDLFYTIPFTVTTSYSSSCHCLNSNMFYLKSIIIPTGRPILTEFLKSQKIKFKTFLIEYSVRSFLDNSLIKS